MPLPALEPARQQDHGGRGDRRQARRADDRARRHSWTPRGGTGGWMTARGTPGSQRRDALGRVGAVADDAIGRHARDPALGPAAGCGSVVRPHEERPTGAPRGRPGERAGPRRVADDGVVADRRRARAAATAAPARRCRDGGTARRRGRAAASPRPCKLPRQAAVEADGDLVGALGAPRPRHRQQHPLDAAEQVAGGDVEQSQPAVGHGEVRKCASARGWCRWPGPGRSSSPSCSRPCRRAR